ncbi:MAG: DNA-binding response regulator [Candidatus Dactylopiibacterium carminicum]|uniref:DNA-binding response regulator n=1 Tax=Candidatus Dactylopiibacterium carminicum TaxID=857335 RepID=A0A272ET93_9RHOO|nr:response regulator transcription factor [Candidatus Dactylopiibacterium carminicum]KAF7599324.1 DNA-binding response regulator [Candidatus Dactylopiibacterium carminicum]PAS93315.1 MAG: DNA-binding response regulator [Candidatus Dactylopiibacterium carminicum]PAS94337.1 MAG: DNA-binding response regulator [Candidatus Dactylopiibacterium carminicum]PAS99327.1 MAG: DNA-binding response regulator [Candidatus Dactylopiibacterium carminicum]
MNPCRVLVIEDHALVREALVRALDQLDQPCFHAQAASAAEALALVEAGQEFDLVLTDLMLPDMSGFSLLSVLAHRFPTIPVVVISALSDEASVKRALKAGAAGFISKALSSEQLIAALRAVLRGDVVTPDLHQPAPVAPRPIRKRGVEPLAEQYGLTTAQTRVMELMVEGRTNREIADLLGLAEGTVKVHCSAILRALGVPNRAQALVVLGRQGLRA